MSAPPSGRAPLGALLAALLLSCIWTAEAAFTSPFVLAPVAAMVKVPAPRLEIRDLMANKYSATLFIRALTVLQNRPYTRLDSYAAMAAIHGSPKLYDKVSLGTDGQSGYCVHGNHFFGPWHRPYLSLLEQALYEQAVALAANYKTADKAQYVAAANRMRLPFWDTARAGGRVPTVLLRPTFDVTLPNGARARVRNPLSTWTIPSATRTYYEIEDGFKTITRDAAWKPSSSPVLDIISDLRRDTVSMFQATTFACFTSGASPCTNTGSLEQIHNQLHVTIGGDGHMSYLGYAAYDPIFFLHHCNVDRQLAIWEGINPKVKMNNIANNNAYPFRKPGTNAWWRTRDLMRTYTGKDSRTWGYYYPEFATATVTPQQLRAKVNDLYNDNKGKAVTVVTFVNADRAPVDGNTKISLATNVTNNAGASATRRAADPKSTRRTRSVVVEAGDVDLVKASTRAGRFSVSKVNVDITDALQQIKEENPSVKNVSIVATVTPTDDMAVALPAKVNLGTPIVTTMIDGKVIATTAPSAPTTVAKVKDPKAADVKLFEGVKNVTAPVVAGP